MAASAKLNFGGSILLIKIGADTYGTWLLCSPAFSFSFWSYIWIWGSDGRGLIGFSPEIVWLAVLSMYLAVIVVKLLFTSGFRIFWKLNGRCPNGCLGSDSLSDCIDSPGLYSTTNISSFRFSLANSGKTFLAGRSMWELELALSVFFLLLKYPPIEVCELLLDLMEMALPLGLDSHC